jgi:hypothetical protein
MSREAAPVPIMCKCGNQIFEEVSIQGIVLAHAGGGVWRSLHGNCAQCGATFNYSISDQQIRKAIITCKQLNPRGRDDE